MDAPPPEPIVHAAAATTTLPNIHVKVGASLETERRGGGRGASSRELALRRVWREPAGGPNAGAEQLVLETDRGGITTLLHRPAGQPTDPPARGVLWVGGAGGGLEGPARGLYPEACRRLQELGVTGLRLDYRYPNNLTECILDVLLGVQVLRNEGVERIALVGHSFGGAVVISAGALSPDVHAVVPMSTQTYGADLAPDVAPRPLLLIHGQQDEVLPPVCSELVYAAAKEPKTLKLYPGAKHGLDSVRAEVLDLLVEWLPAQLGAASARRGRPRAGRRRV